MSLRIGVDIGGTKILGGVVTDDGRILDTERVASPRQDPMAATATIIGVVQRLRERTVGEIHSVGLGVAALVDFDRTRVITAPNLGWMQQPLGADVTAATGLRTVVENDGNAAAWGEFVFGAGRELNDVVVVTVGTGIGGGLILRGALRRGAHGGAAEIGHMNVIPEGRPCGCGRRGCWEQYASGHALVREARELAGERRQDASILLALGDGTPEGVQGRHVMEAARAGDLVARQAFETIGTWLGRGLADLSAIIDPQAFIIGGGVSEAGDLLLMSARSTLSAKVIGGTDRLIPPVISASLGNEAGLVGAADLARLPN
ncbi:MAG: ROK family glucokinase [Candidatus Nanopelagicales bacterium]|jgi:glucokinase|nr:ROK family glucokinase [Candidatus Nanopelagicales bacterium]MDP4824332.1 ROK family glucokinase [Candidatus Nanopelagicales bacterium]MDP4889004.1 ROK family glucokinase [Candidatus Nanopelagicales bacterium]